MIRTFETRLDLRGADTSHLADVLDQYADLMARAERLLFAKLKAGRSFSGDLHVCLYKPLGITSTHLNMIHRQLQGKLSSVKEIAKERIGTIDRKIKFKLDDIVRKEKAIDKLRIDLARKVDDVKDLGKSVEVWRKRLCTQSGLGTSENLWPLKNRLTEYHAAVAAVATARTNLRSLKAAVHQHRRRLARLHHVREPAVKQVADPSLCFGSNKLFRSQLDLAGNGYGDHAKWHNEWQAKRSASMSLEGNSATSCGNPFAKLRKNDNGTFDLELRLPAALDGFEARSFRSSGHVIRCIDFTDLSFNHGDAVIEQVLESGRPVTVRFLRDALSWKVMVSVDHVLERKAADFSCGALGIDLNAGHVSAALVDADGNPVETFHIPCVTYGKSSAQAKDSVRKAVAKIVDLAQFHGVPIVAERLDFSRKKETLKANGDALYARMLSAFSYCAFGQALDSACLRNGVALCRVNPAYTSIIGRVKFARRYGLSVHQAASVTIARRAMGYSERLPNATEAGTIAVPTNGSVHVTLDLPVRNGLRHVWTEWNKLNKEYHKRALAALRSSGRRSRRPRRCVPASEGRNKHSFHGLVTKVGRSR